MASASIHARLLSFPNPPLLFSSYAFRLNQPPVFLFHAISNNEFFVGTPISSSSHVKAPAFLFPRSSSLRCYTLLEGNTTDGGGNDNNDGSGNHNNDDDDDDRFEVGSGTWDWTLCGLLILATNCIKNNENWKRAMLLFLSLACCHLAYFQKEFAFAEASLSVPDKLWEVKGGKWARLVPDVCSDAFVVDGTISGRKNDDPNGTSSPSASYGEQLSKVVMNSLSWCRDLVVGLMLPEGYPESVTSDYLEYSLWRAVQNIASQVNGVLTTQALLYAVGLGKGAIPTAAAVNWVIKDGIGYLSKIMLSKYGRHFDVHPKGWRLFADLLENAAYGLELLTPSFPELFVFIGAIAGAGRSASAMIQAATRSCFCAGFAAQRNFAEVIAKGEAQGMVSKSIGIMLGISLANYVASSGPLTAASFAVVTAVHMFCNIKSYQSIQLRGLNPYRASLVFSEYLLTGQVPSVKEVNDEEPLCSGLPVFRIKFMQQVFLSLGVLSLAISLSILLPHTGVITATD